MSLPLAWHVVIDLAYLVMAPFLILYLAVVSRCFTRPKYRRGLLAKLTGAAVRSDGRPSFWVHAVSVGEVLTALPLIRRLKERYPAWDVGVSVATFTGFEVAEKKLPGTTVFYAPLDFSAAVLRAFRRRRPTLLVLVELELWPNLLLAACRHGVPVLVANGRITERSARRYALAGGLTRRLFGLVTSYAVQNEVYKERFLHLGVEPARLEVLGNLKDDQEPSPLAARGEAVRRALGWRAEATLVLVAGSTHPGEERMLCGLHQALKRDNPRLRLVVVPRHVERLAAGAEIAGWFAPSLAGESQVRTVRWSGIRDEVTKGAHDQSLSPGDAVLVVDTVGELETFYNMADVVLVGGSIVPHGGHNLFEAARLAKPILFGPHFENFRDQAKLLLKEEAAVCVRDEEDLRSALCGLMADSAERARIGALAAAVAARQRGATDRHLEWVARQLQLSLPAID